MCGRSDLAKSNVTCRTTEQMVENYMIKITEGYMVNIFDNKQAAHEMDEQKANAGGESSEVTRTLRY